MGHSNSNQAMSEPSISHFQPQVIGRQQLQPPDVIIGTVKVKERFMQLTSATLPEAFAFLALSKQEQHIVNNIFIVVNMFIVRSFYFQDPESLREQYNEEFMLFHSSAILTLRVLSYMFP